MSQVVEFVDRQDLRELALVDLLRRAEAFGNVRVHSSRESPPPECYTVNIEFDSVPGTSVRASSEFGMEIHEAFIQAIDRAERIVKKYS